MILHLIDSSRLRPQVHAELDPVCIIQLTALQSIVSLLLRRLGQSARL